MGEVGRVMLLAVALGALLTGCAAAEVSDWGDDGGGDGPAAVDASRDAPPADGGRDASPAASDTGVADAGAPDTACTNTTTPENCGSCGRVCPGYGQTTAVVGCTAPDCTFACRGAHYDADADPATGCEVADDEPGYHSQGAAFNLGQYPCTDGDSQQHIVGVLPADMRAHQDPAVVGFDATTGSAPDWYSILAGGGICQNDIALTLTVTGSLSPACYQLRAITDQGTYSCQTSSAGSCGFSKGMGSYSDGSTIYVAVERTCAAAATGASYVVTGHL